MCGLAFVFLVCLFEHPLVSPILSLQTSQSTKHVRWLDIRGAKHADGQISKMLDHMDMETHEEIPTLPSRPFVLSGHLFLSSLLQKFDHNLVEGLRIRDLRSMAKIRKAMQLAVPQLLGNLRT